MGRRGNGYGSEDHFLRWRTERAAEFDALVLKAVGSPGRAAIEWVYPTGRQGEREPQGLRFLRDRADALERWKKFWPDTLRQQTWDGVARLVREGAEPEWLLFEAKANHPEFVTSPCGADNEESLRTINKALDKTKKHLGVHRHFCWTGSYYQYANRLATLYFLTAIAGVLARLVHVYFCGDEFPDGRWCPATEQDWKRLIEARDLTLGLPDRHAMSGLLHQIFTAAPH
jgi:hypothetical protein